MNKRAIIILSLIFVLIVGTLGFLLWSRSKSAGTTATTNTNENSNTSTQVNTNGNTNNSNTNGALGSSAVGAVKLVTESVVSPILFYDASGISYFNTTGQVTRLDVAFQDGRATLSNKTLVNLPVKNGITKVFWPNDGGNFIVETVTQTGKVWSYFAESTNSYKDLPTQITSLVWSPDISKIYYVWKGSNGKNTLNISDSDGSNYKKLADMYNSDIELSLSPDNKVILFYRNQNTGDKNPITLVTIDGQVFKTIVKDGYNLGAIWSPDSKSFAFFRKDSSSQNYVLWIGNVYTGEVKNMGVSVAGESAVWTKDSKGLYVSAKGNGSGAEKIVKVDISASKVSDAVPAAGYIASNMFLNKEENYIFFRDTISGGLYGSKLNSNSTGSSQSTNSVVTEP